jgi:hypothetical protein
MASGEERQAIHQSNGRVGRVSDLIACLSCNLIESDKLLDEEIILRRVLASSRVNWVEN